MLLVMGGLAMATTPTSTGVGSMKWGTPAGPDFSPCGSMWADVQPVADLYGVVPDQLSAGFPNGTLAAVQGAFVGKMKGDQIRAAATRALGAPYEPFRDDLYWSASSGHLIVRLQVDDGGSAILSIADAELVSKLRYRDDEPEWWEISVVETKAKMGLGPMPEWPLPTMEGAKEAWRQAVDCGEIDPPDTSATSFDAMWARAKPAESQSSAPDPAEIAARIAREAQVASARAEIQSIVDNYCTLPFWPKKCKRAKADLAQFDVENSAH